MLTGIALLKEPHTLVGASVGEARAVEAVLIDSFTNPVHVAVGAGLFPLTLRG
jgi:hypothetical protein